MISTHGGVTYFGKWQGNAGFIRTYGHTDPWAWVRNGRFTMPEAQQDALAYRGWLARGWQPWSCA